MVPEHMKKEIRYIWSKAFEELKRLKEHEIRQHFTPRQMVGLYAVAAICYDDGNHSRVIIRDDVFDRLCESLLEHFNECVAAGADYLDRKLLRCHSGYDTKIFVKPYHNIAEVFLGHSCRCIKCTH